MLPINRHPTGRELRSFGILLVIFVALLGGLVLWRTDSATWARTIWIGGGLLALTYHLAPAARRPIYVGWMYAAFPIGWAISHLLMALIYYGVLTPIGWALRARGRDPLQRRFDRSARTYWVQYTPQRDIERYFKQF
jgi:hypothetical protein